MKSTSKHYLSSRVFKVNVGFLLSAGSGNYQDSRFDILTPVQLSEDLIVNAVEGSLRLTRAKEGILVQARLAVEVDNTCSRCLDVVAQTLDVDVEELFAHPASNISEFSVGADAMLDLAPLLRAEVLIGMSHRVLCHEACRGLCAECGTNLNHNTCDCVIEKIDPRLAKLKELLDK